MIPCSLESLTKIRASLARDSLREFIKLTWSIVEPTTRLSWNWHHDAIAEGLQAVSHGEIKRLLINIPPGGMKSLMLVFFNAWEWTWDPSKRFLTFAFSDVNPIRDNRRVRQIVTSDLYSTSYGVSLSADQSAKTRFDNTAGGWRIAAGRNGAGTGEHPDRIIIDDIMKASESHSLVALDECVSFMRETVSSRMNRNPAVVLMMQRLHMEDLAGFALSQGGWETICFPMRFAVKLPNDTSDQRPLPDRRDRRTTPGELLWPDMFPEEKVARMELELGEYASAAQLNQNPVPEGGAEFKRTWFQIVDVVPNDLFKVRGWDAGGADAGSDRSAGTLVGESFSSDDVYILDHIAGNYGDIEYDRLMKQTAELDGPDVLIREEREGASSGKSVTKAHARMLKGYDYAEVIISGKAKSMRRRPFRAQAQAGNVYLLRGAWNAAYIDEICSIPFGKHDDAGDSTSVAYNAIVAEKKKPRRYVGSKRNEERRKAK